MIGSGNFVLSCDIYQFPWSAEVTIYEWSTDTEIPLINTPDRQIASRVSRPYSESFIFNGTVSFDRLSVRDLGPYTCLVSLNLTYPDGPDNSTAIITNSTTFELTADGMCVEIISFVYPTLFIFPQFHLC